MSPKNSQYRRGLAPPWWYFHLSKNNFKFIVDNKVNIKSNQDAIILGTEYMENGIELNPELNNEKELMLTRMQYDEFSKFKNYVLVLRSPWNQLASILAWKKRWYLKNKDRFIHGWLNSANEYLGITHFLPKPKIFINFDEWFVNKQYRQLISEKMNIKFSDRGLNIVLPMGYGKKGSSFDKMTYMNKAQNMNVLNRWKKYYDNKIEFRDVLKSNKELKTLSKEIFGSFPWEK
jgi:hypothetical protein